MNKLLLIGREKFLFEVLEVLWFLYQLRHLDAQETPALPLSATHRPIFCHVKQ